MADSVQNEPKKIVPLHEDMHGHTHDDASYQKMIAQQNAMRDALKKNGGTEV